MAARYRVRVAYMPLVMHVMGAATRRESAVNTPSGERGRGGDINFLHAIVLKHLTTCPAEEGAGFIFRPDFIKNLGASRSDIESCVVENMVLRTGANTNT